MLSVARAGITFFLLYVGCRWLLATNCFSDLILNAVALEFILLLKEAFYVALVPLRNKLDLGITTIEPYQKQIQPALSAFVGSITLLLVAIAWVFLYMRFFQQVLPVYNWDVREPCVNFIKKRFEV